MFPAIAPQPSRGHGRYGRLLRGRLLTWLGTISYGIYLWNRVVLQLIHRHPEPRGLPGTLLTWLAVLGGTIALGAASWYLVERPLQRALRTGANRAPGGGRTPEIDRGVQSLTDGLNPSGVAVDHLA